MTTDLIVRVNVRTTTVLALLPLRCCGRFVVLSFLLVGAVVALLD